MDKENKRLLREEKRAIKKDGNRSRRRYLQRQLDEDPDNAHYDDYDYNDYNSSTRLNGIDQDSTRKKKEEWEQFMNGQDNISEEERY